DLHVHTEWSYDGPNGSMERSCERAIEIGLPAIAFTDHADFVKVHPDQYCVDIVGYLDAVERCRAKFTGLRILSGVELGEPHWFSTVAHLDYPKRYWQPGRAPYKESDYEEMLRAILVATAKRGCALEVNTTRGGGETKLCPGLTVLRWWREVGGAAVSFASDAHDPSKIAAGFELAAEVVEAAGFKPSAEPTALWRR